MIKLTDDYNTTMIFNEDNFTFCVTEKREPYSKDDYHLWSLHLLFKDAAYTEGEYNQLSFKSEQSMNRALHIILGEI